MWNSMGKADLIGIDLHFLIAENQFNEGVAFQQLGRVELEFQHFTFTAGEKFVFSVSGFQSQNWSWKDKHFTVFRSQVEDGQFSLVFICKCQGGPVLRESQHTGGTRKRE